MCACPVKPETHGHNKESALSPSRFRRPRPPARSLSHTHATSGPPCGQPRLRARVCLARVAPFQLDFLAPPHPHPHPSRFSLDSLSLYSHLPRHCLACPTRLKQVKAGTAPHTHTRTHTDWPSTLPRLASPLFTPVLAEAMEHREDFEVVTTPDGASTLPIRLACATVTEHYQRTTTAHSSVASDPAEVCSTGLRVYEGAQVLAAFVFQLGVALLPPSQPTSVVELGCGCGLVSFTLDHVLRSAATADAGSAPTPSRYAAPTTIVFTDASADCLALVRRSGALAQRTVLELTGTADDVSDAGLVQSSSVELRTFRLAWSDEGVDALLRHLPPRRPSSCRASSAAVQLVLGSDLLYYRVDVNGLLQAARRLLSRRPGVDGAASGDAEADSFIIFAHFMRIPDGHRKLAAIARDQQRLHISAVPLTAFLSHELVSFRGWNGIELVVMSPRSADGVAGVVAHESESAAAAADVEQLRSRLHARAAAFQHACGRASPAASAAASQARRLASLLEPYPLCAAPSLRHGEGGGGGATASEQPELEAFMNLLL